MSKSLCHYKDIFALVIMIMEESYNYYKAKCQHCNGKGYINRAYYPWQKSKKCQQCGSMSDIQLVDKWNSITGRLESTPLCDQCYHQRMKSHNY